MTNQTIFRVTHEFRAAGMRDSPNSFCRTWLFLTIDLALQAAEALQGGYDRSGWQEVRTNDPQYRRWTNRDSTFHYLMVEPVVVRATLPADLRLPTKPFRAV